MFKNRNLAFGALIGLTLGATPLIFAQSDESVKVGARAGLVSVDDLGSAFAFGGYLEKDLLNGFSLRPSIDYWKKAKSYSSLDADVSDLTFGGAVKYTLWFEDSTLRPYVVGGIAFHRVNIDLKPLRENSYVDRTSSERTETEIGFDLGGGFSYPLTNSIEFSSELLMRSTDGRDVMSITGSLACTL